MKMGRYYQSHVGEMDGFFDIAGKATNVIVSGVKSIMPHAKKGISKAWEFASDKASDFAKEYAKSLSSRGAKPSPRISPSRTIIFPGGGAAPIIPSPSYAGTSPMSPDMSFRYQAMQNQISNQVQSVVSDLKREARAIADKTRAVIEKEIEESKRREESLEKEIKEQQRKRKIITWTTAGVGGAIILGSIVFVIARRD